MFAWSAAAAICPHLPNDEVHVWCLPLQLPEDLQAYLMATLSPDERERANRYAHRQIREQFTSARGFLRNLLGRYLGHDPASLQLELSPTGKPILPGRSLYFNVSHSHELCLIALTRHGEVGVDIERVRHYPMHLDMADRYFTPGESAALHRLVPPVSEEAFFHVWTRKEAFLKATGLGLSHGLERFEVSVPPNDPPRILHIDGDSKRASRWSLHALYPSPGYVGALALEGQIHRVVLHHWFHHGVPSRVLDATGLALSG
jgi:4'-phosphopantetheinyl transferase